MRERKRDYTRGPVDFSDACVISAHAGYRTFREGEALRGDGRAGIADLGLAKEIGVTEQLPSDTSLGTPDYMSPEQVNNSETVDLRSDIYSLGATLFHMICGKAPYTGHSAYEVMVMHVAGELPSPKKYRPDLPRDVCDVMRKMMARDLVCSAGTRLDASSIPATGGRVSPGAGQDHVIMIENAGNFPPASDQSTWRVYGRSICEIR